MTPIQMTPPILPDNTVILAAAGVIAQDGKKSQEMSDFDARVLTVIVLVVLGLAVVGGLIAYYWPV